MDIQRFFDQATSTLTYVVHGPAGAAANHDALTLSCLMTSIEMRKHYGSTFLQS